MFSLPEGERASTQDLWRRAETAGVAARSTVGAGGICPMVLTASSSALAVLIGCWRSGLTPASLPAPARAMGLDAYVKQLRCILASLGAEVILIAEAYRPFLVDTGLRVATFEELCTARAVSRPRLDSDETGFIQFTSGTTGQPRGVMLSQDAMGANVRALVEAYDARPGDVSVSWLPLSHDMGLFGMCLAPWVAGGDEYAGGGEAHLMSPETFLLDPWAWIQTMADAGATVSAAPPFGLEMVLRRSCFNSSPSLASLRALVVGSELIAVDGLRRFDRLLGELNVTSPVVCPAYGLAEATLGVTMVRPGHQWSAVTGDDSINDETEFVVCGEPLEGVAVSVQRDLGNAGGRIQVESEGALDGYWDDTQAAPCPGVIVTGDRGFLVDGQLVVTGRADDVLILAGRNVSANVIERAASVEGVRRGTAVAVRDSTGQLAVALEVDRGAPEELVLISSVQRAVANTIGISARVIVLPRDSVPKTPSGKLKRHEVRQLLG